MFYDPVYGDYPYPKNKSKDKKQWLAIDLFREERIEELWDLLIGGTNS